jgi:inorganic pyrophosphatase
MVRAFLVLALAFGEVDFKVPERSAARAKARSGILHWAQSLNSEVQVKNENGKYQMYRGDYALSFWHDLPLEPPREKGLYHFVCEIPKGTTAKMEINKEAELNPIIQDTKDGKPRFYKYKPEVGSLVNYGALPQTWEDPNTKDTTTNLGGDNDPIDVLQVNSKPCKIGDIQRVKVLGAFALIDDGETDWKVFVVDVDDMGKLNRNSVTLNDLKTPEEVKEIVEWFEKYKTAEGKGLNKIGLDGQIVSAEKATEIIKETNKHWMDLFRRKTSKAMKEQEL